MIPVLKILTPKVIKGIMTYVFEKNNLDEQMDMVLHRLDELEKMAHPMRNFVICNKCNQQIKEK
tara:strand:- start:569 stop:760 length:192 start_codon:yes stop_codon:yes gene_type:complete